MSHLRLSPSGPVLADIGGGFRTKFKDTRSAVSTGAQNIPTTPATIGFVLGTPPALELAFPVDLTLVYRATMLMDIRNVNPSTPSTIQLDLFVDWGDGAGFVSAAPSTHLIGGVSDRQIRVDATPLTPPVGATQVVFEAKISNPLTPTDTQVVSPGTGPTIYFSIEELLP